MDKKIFNIMLAVLLGFMVMPVRIVAAEGPDVKPVTMADMIMIRAIAASEAPTVPQAPSLPSGDLLGDADQKVLEPTEEDLEGEREGERNETSEAGEEVLIGVPSESPTFDSVSVMIGGKLDGYEYSITGFVNNPPLGATVEIRVGQGDLQTSFLGDDFSDYTWSSIGSVPVGPDGFFSLVTNGLIINLGNFVATPFELTIVDVDGNKVCTIVYVS